MSSSEETDDASFVSPILDALTPDHGTSAGKTAMTIHGHGLGDSEFVVFHRTKVKAINATSKSVKCVSPKHDLGTVQVYVVLTDDTPSNKPPYRYL